MADQIPLSTLPTLPQGNLSQDKSPPLATLPQVTTPSLWDALRAFGGGGLTGLAKAYGMQMPGWSNAMGNVLQNPDLNTAIGMTSPIKGAGSIEDAFAQIRKENAGLTREQRRAKFEAAQQAEQDRIDNMSDEERAAYYDQMDQALRDARAERNKK